MSPTRRGEKAISAIGIIPDPDNKTPKVKLISDVDDWFASPPKTLKIIPSHPVDM